MKSAKPTPQRPARPRGATPAPDRAAERPTPSRGKRGAPAASSAPAAPPRAPTAEPDSAELPPGWTNATLAEVVTDAQSGFASGEKDTEGGIAHLRMNNIGVDGELVLNLVRTVPAQLAKPQYDLIPGDVLVCTTNSGKLVGKCTLFDLKGRFAFSNHITRLRPDTSKADGKFLRWSLWLNWRRGAFDDQCKHWVNQSTLPKTALLSTSIPLPPLAEQRRIVAKLEELLGKVEASRQRLAQVPALLKRFRQAVLAAACSGRLTADWRAQRAATVYPFAAESPALAVAEEQAPYGLSASASAPSAKSAVKKQTPEPGRTADDTDNAGDLPEGWSWKTVEELAKIGSGQSSAKVISACQERGDIAWFKVSDMNLPGNEKEMITSRSYLSEASAQELRMRRFPSGTIVFPKRGGAISTNKKRFLPKPSCIDMNLMALTPTGCDGHYFWLWFLTIDLGQMADGSSVPQINNPDILPLPVPLPPLPEQEEIVRRVEALFAVADRLEARFEQARAQVDRLAPALLAKAFRGELVPQDPRDPPAAALLEQLCGEK